MADPMDNPPCRELDRITLGLRAAMAIKAENAGTVYQRTAFRRPGQPWQPPRDAGRWRFNFTGSVCTSLTWGTFHWPADA